MRKLKYSEALAEATLIAMEEDPRVFLMGEGIDDPKGTFGTTLEAFKRFGQKRVFDTPLSESAVTGIGIGAAIEGAPCVMIHMRNEFLMLAMDPIVNHAAKWHYMFGGVMKVPITIRVIVGRGWGQAAQHSQSLQALWAHIPGLKVILPSTPYEAKGLLYSAIKDPNPVICIEHRWLYGKEEEVPEGPYEIPIGKAKVIGPGQDLTCVAVSHQVYEAMEAREKLLEERIRMEVIDLRSVRPLDLPLILDSVRKTGRLLVTDTGIKSFGVSAEICAAVCETGFETLKAAPVRVALPDAPTPCSYALEEAYYPKVGDLMNAARQLVHGKRISQTSPRTVPTPADVPFTGPF